MKRLLLFGLLLLAKLAPAQDIPDRPNPPRLVNDLAHVLTDDQAQTLEQKLKAYDDSTSSQIAIVTVPTTSDTTGDYEVEEYALKLLRTWGVGSKKHNNGIVILAVIDKHRMRIEVGDGLEGAITDLLSKEIIENDMAPNFRAGNYYRGFDQATDDIIKAAAGEYKAGARAGSRDGRGKGGNIIGIFVIFIIILIVLSRINGGGGSGGGTFSRGGFWPGLLIGSMLNQGGGGSGGGSDWGGGGGGGGFGGFGGGSGSGGGASGSW